jgi:hypothetical protein
MTMLAAAVNAQGSLRAALDSCLLEDRVTGAPHYATVLGLALGVARAMHHLHSEGVLHGDLKVCCVSCFLLSCAVCSVR